ncbi:unnamed protein product [Parajaminaea phylloscopi]
MKGHAFRKLSRTTGHRNHLLRNLVTSLFQHERISTTVAKAREAQREAEKIITKAKRAVVSQARAQTAPSQQLGQAHGYVFSRGRTMPILQRLALRYANRPGGYTRLHLHGNRPGDHAPRALLELVDNAKGDLRFEMTARAIARSIYLHGLRRGNSTPAAITPLSVPRPETDSRFSPTTRLYIAKAFNNQAGGPEEAAERKRFLLEKADEHLRRIQAEGLMDQDAGVATKEEEASDAASAASSSSTSSPSSAWRKTDQARLDEPSWGDHKPRGRLLTPPRVGTPLFAGMDPTNRPGGGSVYQPKPLSGSKGRNSVVRLAKGVFARREQREKRNPPAFVSARQQQQQQQQQQRQLHTGSSSSRS